MAAKRKAERARRDFRSGGRSCGNYAGCGIRESDVSSSPRADRGSVLFLDGDESKIAIRLRRLARRIRSAWGRRDDWRAADGNSCVERDPSDFQGREW